jgi:hypothetical protein
LLQIAQQGSTPSLSSVTPNTVSAHSSDTAITIAGSKFGNDATVSFTPPGGSPTTIYANLIQAAQMAATIPAALMTTAGTGQIGVRNGNGTLSNQLPFTITSTVPAVSSVSPNTVSAHSASLPVTIAGSNFASGATVYFTPPGGAPTPITPSLIQAAQIAATIPSTLLTSAGTAQVAVQSAFGESSNQLPFTITSVLPSQAGIFRGGYFWLEDVDGNRQFNSPPDRAFAFGGVAGDIPITGDWNGSGTTKVGVYRPSNGLFVLDYDGDGQFTGADRAYNLGVGIDPTDVPVVGDWNGDGKTKVGLFRQGYFWILDTNGNGVFQQGVDQTFAFGGVAGDVPVVGDWNGSGTSKIGLLRQGFFWILDANGNGSLDNVNGVGGDQAFAFGGIAGDVPVVGDWNGDGKSKVGMFRSGFFWVLDANGNHTFDGTGVGQDLAFPFGGLGGDKPVVGKW